MDQIISKNQIQDKPDKQEKERRRMDNHLFYIVTGGGIQLVLFLFYKKLRNPQVFWIVLIMTIGLGVFGLLNMDRPALQMPKGNAANWMLLPFLFMIYFGALRMLFLKTFKNEPLMTGYMQTSWEQGEYRRLHFGDALFTIFTLILPFLTILLIG